MELPVTIPYIGAIYMVAAIGLAVNIVAFVILRGGDKDNLNISGAALHVAGDLLSNLCQAGPR